MGVVKTLELDKDRYLDCKIGKKDYAMKKPSVRHLIEMEDNCVSADGKVDLPLYVESICSLLTPSVELDDIVKFPKKKILELDGVKVTLKDITAKKALVIANSGTKIVRDEEDNEKVQIKVNQVGMIDSILELSDTKLDDMSYKNAKKIPEAFNKSFETEVSTLTGLYEFFQKNFQA